MEESDEELTAILIATLDTAVFGEMVRRNQQIVRNMLLRLTGSREMADDLAQDTFVKAFESLNQYKGVGTFKSWLCQVAYSRFLLTIRRRKIENRAIEELLKIVEDEPVHFDIPIEMDVSAALSILNPDEKACIIVCYMADFSHTEAVKELALPLGTIKSHLKRGREKLLKVLSKA